MTYIVNDNCIKCKLMDCVEVCPVDAIEPDTNEGANNWIDHNTKYSELWPVITKKGIPPEDEAKWRGVPDKFKHFSEKPGGQS